MDKTKIKSNILALSIIGIPIGLLLMSVGVINDGCLVSLTKDALSDAGMTLLGLSFLTFCAIPFFFTPKEDEETDTLGTMLIGIGMCFIFLVMTIYGAFNLYNAILDFQTEPKKVYLEDCNVYCEDLGRNFSAHYYIIGYSEDGEVQYEIPRKKFAELRKMDSFKMELLVYENTEVIPSMKIVNGE